MTPTIYKAMIDLAETNANGKGVQGRALAFASLNQAINKLSHDERRTLRSRLTSLGERRLIRSLYYDYTLQVWI